MSCVRLTLNDQIFSFNFSMILTSRSISLDSIIPSSTWNLHPWELNSLPGDLASSFLRSGILHPPILLPTEGSRFEIVCGFKRLFFASSILKSREIDCLILAAGTEPAVILDILLTDQSLAGPLSMAEKARFIEICGRYLQRQQIADTFRGRLLLDNRPSTISRLQDFSGGDPQFIAAIHAGALQEKVVMELLELPLKGDRIALVQLFNNLRMGDGKQRRILSLFRDLAFHRNTSIAAILQDSSIQEILNHQAMNNPQKTQHLASYLQNQLNPLSAHAEKEFTDNVKALKIPENCTISHSPSFERDEVTVSITFKDFAACREWLPTLKKSFNSLS